MLAHETKNWRDSDNGKAWKLQLQRPSPDPFALSVFLGKLVCSDESDGYIAKAISRRAPYNSYTGDLDIFSREVSRVNGRGAKFLDDHSKVKLCESSASWSENDVKNSFCARSAIGSNPSSPENTQD